MKKIKCTKKLELKLELRISKEQRGGKTQSSRTVQELLASYWSLWVSEIIACVQ